MIFAKLFKSQAKYKHKNLNVRITAINEELSAESDIIILESLAQQDESDLVRRAALMKLNSFPTWLSASESNNQAKVKDFAEKQIQAILFGQHSLTLSSIEKQQFLLQNKHKASFLETWLQHENSNELIIAIYQQLQLQVSKPQLLMTLFTQKPNEEIQQFLLQQAVETSILEKLLKKACNDVVANSITEKLETLEFEKQKPVKLKKSAQLVLSKLLALKENSDYGRYLNKSTELEQEWLHLSKEFPCLPTDVLTEFTGKYETIQLQLTKLFAPKAEAFQQQKIADKLDGDKAIAKDEFSQDIVEINQILSTAVFENEPPEQQAFNEKLQELKQKISDSVLNEKEQFVFLTQVKQQQERLSQLPEIAESVTEATHLISKVAQLALPKTLSELNERQQIFEDWLKQWRVVEQKSNGILPASIKNAYLELTSVWKSGLKSLQQEQKNLFNQNKKKLHDLKRLVAGGKFKISFGIFKGLTKTMPLLSAHQQHQLQRDFDSLSEKMAELSDWEHYIATPRKQQLLTDILQLVEQPLDNPNEQAEKVKAFRKSWNSLGHADEEIDQPLNEQFNEACEQAFAPCRLFYAEQEKLREQHLQQRNQIIDQATQLAASLDQKLSAQEQPDFKYIDGQLNKIQQTWFDAGEVDREKYLTLQQKFKSILQPVKLAIKAFHDGNMAQKSQLITLAKQQLDQDDIFAAIEEVKSLQQQWRDVGYAGARQENKLWQAFRTVNDELFTKRDNLKNEQQQAQVTQKNDFNKLFESLKEKGALLITTQKVVLQQHKDAVKELLSEVVRSKPVIKVVANKIEQYISELDEQLTQLDQRKEKQDWQHVFQVLSSLVEDDVINLQKLEAYMVLGNFWQKKIQEHTQLSSTSNDNGESIFDERSQKTLALEILAGAESPAEFSKQRMEVQVKLMQHQMSSGDTINLQQHFIEWLQLGKLSQQDKALLERVRILFC